MISTSQEPGERERERATPPDIVQSDVVSDPDDGTRIIFDNNIFIATLSHLLRSWLEVRRLGVGRLTVGRWVGVTGVRHV